MIKDALLTQLVAKQEELFRTDGNSAQREIVLMQIRERQKVLKEINGGGV